MGENVEQDQQVFADKRILLVEDNPLNVKIMGALLDKHGITVEIANNGDEAVNMFMAREIGYYHAILMDIQMPVMDGLTATWHIRHGARTDGAVIPIIILSSTSADLDERDCQEMNVPIRLSKPVNPKELLAALRRYFT